MLARLRAMLAHLGAMLAHLGAMLAHLGAMWAQLAAHVGPSGGYVGPHFGAYVGPCWPILIHKIEKIGKATAVNGGVFVPTAVTGAGGGREGSPLSYGEEKGLRPLAGFKGLRPTAGQGPKGKRTQKKKGKKERARTWSNGWFGVVLALVVVVVVVVVVVGVGVGVGIGVVVAVAVAVGVVVVEE